MQISSISATNFGILIKDQIQIYDNVDITPKDYRRISKIAKELNKESARGITVYGIIGQPAVTDGKKVMRVVTAPTRNDMNQIHSFRPEAKSYTYKRRSKWVDLYSPDIIGKFSDFVRRQKGFIHHCTIDPNHSAEPFDSPKWRPNGTPTLEVEYPKITLKSVWG